jgi:hypothetical protein
MDPCETLPAAASIGSSSDSNKMRLQRSPNGRRKYSPQVRRAWPGVDSVHDVDSVLCITGLLLRVPVALRNHLSTLAGCTACCSSRLIQAIRSQQRSRLCWLHIISVRSSHRIPCIDTIQSGQDAASWNLKFRLESIACLSLSVVAVVGEIADDVHKLTCRLCSS